MPMLREYKGKIVAFLNNNFSGKEIIFFVFLSIFSFIGILLFLNSQMQKTWIDRIVYKGSISEGIVGTPAHIHIAFGNEETTKSLSNILFSPLAKQNEEGKLIYDLASNINYDASNTQYQITLKNNLKFQDNSPITTDDVIYTFDLISKSEFTKYYKNILANLTLNKIDNNNLVLKEKKHDIQTEKLFEIGIIPKHIFENKENELSTISENTIGSGSFKISKITRSNNQIIDSLTFTRFKNGDDKLPYIKNFIINFFGNSNDATDALYKGKISLLTNIDADSLERLKIKNQNLKTQTNSTDKNFALFINQSKNEILQSKKFRQVLSSVIDRNYLSKNVMKEFASPKEFLFNNEITALSASNTENLLASTSLIIDNGIMYNSKKVDGKKVKTEESIKLTISVPKVKELEDAADFIKLEFKKIGIETEVVVVNNESLPDILKNRDFELLLFPFNVEESSDLYNFLTLIRENILV
jgi:peptide/nickel transport system substrate-binding protein